MCDESSAATRHFSNNALTLTVAGTIASAVSKPWESKGKYPALYPAYNHRVTEGYE